MIVGVRFVREYAHVWNDGIGCMCSFLLDTRSACNGTDSGVHGQSGGQHACAGIKQRPHSFRYRGGACTLYEGADINADESVHMAQHEAGNWRETVSIHRFKTYDCSCWQMQL